MHWCVGLMGRKLFTNTIQPQCVLDLWRKVMCHRVVIGQRSVFRGVRLFCGAITFHLHFPPVVDVPPGRGLPLHLLQPPNSAATAVAARTHWDLGNSGQHGDKKGDLWRTKDRRREDKGKQRRQKVQVQERDGDSKIRGKKKQSSHAVYSILCVCVCVRASECVCVCVCVLTVYPVPGPSLGQWATLPCLVMPLQKNKIQVCKAVVGIQRWIH